MNSRKIAGGLLLVLASGCAEGRLDGAPSATVPPAPRLTQSVAAVVASPEEAVQRSAATDVSPRVTSLTVDYTSPSFDNQGARLTSRTFHRVVSGPVVKQFIAALNDLSVPDPGSGACPRDDNERFLLSMDNAGNSLSFSLTACGRVVVIAGGYAQPELVTTSVLDTLVAAAAGAPAAS